MEKEITIIIKTFNRKRRLKSLVKSIKRYYPDIKIIILDDSRHTYETYIKRDYKDIEYITTEYDIGLSKGRNLLLDRVKTKYFVLCDDDFVFDERTRLDVAKNNIEEQKADIVGGAIYNRYQLNSVYSLLWVMKKPRRIIQIIKQIENISIYNGRYSIRGNGAYCTA